MFELWMIPAILWTVICVVAAIGLRAYTSKCEWLFVWAVPVVFMLFTRFL